MTKGGGEGVGGRRAIRAKRGWCKMSGIGRGDDERGRGGERDGAGVT